ncbi:MAG: hypothetical protein DRQ44_08655 [Gammaproteobacteria bacterium]|nr:MAG: hypothetical protein DRQ44_08655 [Gammaproteobacteria bacterium]
MTQVQPDEKQNPVIKKLNTKSFANLWVGIFFLISSLALFILMMMFIFVWQPIWTEGFKDFHTVSNAIDKLNKTAKPASDAVPLMLVEMSKMSKNMYQMNTTLYQMNRMNDTLSEMQNIMQGMNASIGHMEQMTPEIKRMTLSIEQMTMVLSTEIPRMTYTMGRLNNKMPSMGFMPFK